MEAKKTRTKLSDGIITKSEYTEWKINCPYTADDCGGIEPRKIINSIRDSYKRKKTLKIRPFLFACLFPLNNSYASLFKELKLKVSYSNMIFVLHGYP